MSKQLPKVFFWCCKSLGLRTLKFLLAEQKCVIYGVCVSSRDKYAPEIETVAHLHQIRVWSNEVTPSELPAADLGLCIGFPHKISGSVLKIFPWGVINLHFAPLPQYRGSGTLTHAMINQEKKYGVTLHLMDTNLDTGPIIEVGWTNLPSNKTAQEISQDLEIFAFSFFETHLRKILSRKFKTQNQAEIITKQHIQPQFCTKASVTKLYQLEASWPIEKIDRYLRALTTGKPQKPYFLFEGRKIFLSFDEK
jgi:methionyl-tRNA formyltransferase